MSNPIRIGLIGAGKFGGYHANKLADQKDVEFAGVFDKNLTAAKVLAEHHSVLVFESFEEAIGSSDALVIASPASSHGTYAKQALKAGLHVLVEKPLAVSAKDAEILAEFAPKASLIVQVGHQERFVCRAIGLDRIPDKPVLIRARRLNPYSDRGTDTSVTMDLMIHDIDLVLWLMGSQPTAQKSRALSIKTGLLDHVWAELEFDCGEAFLEASRVVEAGHRSLEISYPHGTVSIDLNEKTLVHDTPYDLNDNFGEMADAKDSLAAGLNEFVSAIRTQRTSLISAQDGYNAVAVATQIDAAQ